MQPLPGNQGRSLYGVIHGAVVLLASGALARIETLREGVLQAVVERVALSSWGPEQLSEREEAMVRVERHQNVLQQVLDYGTPLPMRLGTIVRGDHKVRRWLRTAPSALGQALAALDGHQEWGVKLVVTPLEQPRPCAPEEGVPEGVRFVRRKQREREAARAAAEARRRRVQLVESAMVPLGVAHVTLPCRDRCVFNRALLVAESAVATMQQAAHLLNDTLGGETRMALTGPWPAYSFAPALLAIVPEAAGG